MKQIKFTWNANPESSVVAYRVYAPVYGINNQVDANQPLESYATFPMGTNVEVYLYAIANGVNGLVESDPAYLNFTVPTDDYKPSVPTGFSWAVEG